MLQNRPSCLVRFYLLLILILCLHLPSITSGANTQEAANHPLYKSYDFGDSDNVIVFAFQPLGVLHSTVSEIIKRDRILEKVLKSKQLELRILPFYNGPHINHFMAEGKVDISMAGDFPTLTIASSSDVELVAIVKRDKASVVSYNYYNSLMELRGKKIGFPPGTSSHLGLLVGLEASGLEESDVKMVPMVIDELTSALVEGEIDAFAGWEPVPTAAIEENKNMRKVSQFLNTDFIYWTNEFTQKQPETARHFLAAYLRALKWLNANETHLTQAAKWSIKVTESFLGKNSSISLLRYKQQLKRNLNLIGSGAIPTNEFAEHSFLHRAFTLLKNKGLMPENSSWDKVQNNIRQDLIAEIFADPTRYKFDEFSYRQD